MVIFHSYVSLPEGNSMAQLRMFDGSTDRGGATGTSCEAEGGPKFWAEIHGESIGIHGELTNKHRELI